jgi:hypothetical protein
LSRRSTLDRLIEKLCCSVQLPLHAQAGLSAAKSLARLEVDDFELDRVEE